MCRHSFLMLTCLLVLPVYGQNLSIAVATNFAAPLRLLLPLFQQQNATASIQIKPGASGHLYTQIKHGAPYDIFLSADQDKPQKLEQAGLIVPGSRFVYATGKLALWVRQSADQVSSQSLKMQPPQRIAIANPKTAPYGRASIEVMQSLDLYTQMKARLIQGQNVQHAYQFVEGGHVDAGFVALSQIQTLNHLQQVWEIPARHHQPIIQEGVWLHRAKHNKMAQKFISFLQSAPVQQLISEMGYVDNTVR